MRCVGFHVMILSFCNNSARWFVRHATTFVARYFGAPRVQRARAARRGAHPTAQKDSSNMWCDVLVFWDVMLFCNNFARCTKIVAIVMRCVGFLGCYYLFVTTLQDDSRDSSNMCDAICWFFWDVMFFCNNFARCTKIVAIVMRCVGFLGCYYLFVTTLQDDYKR